MWKVSTDGGCPSNPGPGAYAFVIDKQDGSEKTTRSGFLPEATNNQAEYRAVTSAAIFLAMLPELPHLVEIWSDSELVVRQLQGIYRVNDAIRPFYSDARVALETLQTRTKVTITHFKREFNQEADELCNLVLERRGIKFVNKKRKGLAAALSKVGHEGVGQLTPSTVSS